MATREFLQSGPALAAGRPEQRLRRDRHGDTVQYSYGRCGGQALSPARILNTAVIHAGGESTIVPFYGQKSAWRRLRLASGFQMSLFEIGEITFPHIIIIFHPRLLRTVSRTRCHSISA